jgi:hypothetical protein
MTPHVVVPGRVVSCDARHIMRFFSKVGLRMARCKHAVEPVTSHTDPASVQSEPTLHLGERLTRLESLAWLSGVEIIVQVTVALEVHVT